ncbi:hypothetical protein SAMN05216410_2430 [Sanguibacter gelidistatuariae]|uniref:Restriction endonuclease type II-like domain-containing protein n=1 Tax=Sanguibacter gelidistatuariae TaxID=1814289 RepID=A0A1G6Q337_9MICO|nr:hypothetical protein [Sanguibacter gelidistatuariae]SDC86850.1 hypothetical protein SAMN05216410_2430 [Sanguibacter gelidistatuariae]
MTHSTATDPSAAGTTPGVGADQASQAVPTIVKQATTGEIVGAAVDRWRATLVALAGGSTLADVGLLGDAVLDLTAAHPSGIAQLFAGRSTRLANVFREGSSLPVARRRARAVAQRSQEQGERYGVAPTYLAIGVATWTEHVVDQAADDMAALARATGSQPAGQGVYDDAAPVRESVRTVRAPVLLRPINIQARGGGESDYELTLEPTAEINPVLARALRSRGALLDPAALARGAFTGSGFDPSTALDRINSLGSAVLSDFTMVDKLLVGTFVHPGQMLVDDLDDLMVGLERHEIIAALAGDPAAIKSLAHPLPAPHTGDAEPNMERGVGDLDPSGRSVLDALATGSHLFIDAPVGADSTGAIAAVVAEAAAIGRSVLYVPGHRRAADALSLRLAELGLDDLVLDVTPHPSWRASVSRRLLGAMTLEAPHIDAAALADLRLQLVETRTRLSRTIDGLHQAHAPWGISAYDALQALARLTSERPSPATQVRLAAGPLARIAATRPAVGADLVRAANLDAFTLRPASTPWFGADLETEDGAADAVDRITRLLDRTLTDLRTQITAVAEDTGVLPPRTVSQWGEQLAMLAGMRTTLDVFQPMVFERTADDLVAATASRQWRSENSIEMSGLHRRRLVKRAKDMIRPGTRIADLHAGLLEVQAQRETWAAHCPSGGWPRLPEGLAGIEETYASVMTDFVALDAVLATTPGGAGLADLSLGDVTDRLQKLLDDRSALHSLPERTRVVRELAFVGLGPLLEDLSARRVEVGLVEAELDLAWWSSVFEQILAADPHLAEVDGQGIEALADRFRRLDRAHVESLGTPIRAAAVQQIHGALRDNRDQAEGLFAQLVEESLTSVRVANDDFGDVLRKLRPCLIATPTLVPHLLPAHRTVDLVILDAAQHLPVESVLSAIARGRQVVVVGDARCAPGEAVPALAALLPTVALAGDASRRDPLLTAFLVNNGYQGVLRPMPLPSAERLVTFDAVDGAGMPDAASGAVESTQVEVDRVVELAINHALDRPDESLAIITGSRVHADRVREAILSQVRQNAALGPFFDPRRREPVVISDLKSVAGLTREAIIFSVGFGRTPHGRVLHRFGDISGPTGQALLLNAVGATRRRLSVVSCFGAEDLDPERLRGTGAQLLGALLDFAEHRTDPQHATQHDDASPSADQPHPDRLVIDLAERLWRTGLTVETQHGAVGGEQIPLVVGHPDLPGELLVAVLTDDANYTDEPSIRVRDRQRAERLERLGWQVIQVWSVSLFLDPEGQANRIREAVFEIEARRRAARQPVTGTLPMVVLDDAALVVLEEAQGTGDEDLVDPSAPVAVTGAVALVGPDGKVVDAGGEAAESSGAAEPAAGVRAGGPAAMRTSRPDVEPGLPISAYGDNELDELVAWIASDQIDRDSEQLAGALRAELGITRRSTRVDTAVAGAVRRILGG